MREPAADAITGWAAGVPYTALPPAAPGDRPVPLVVAWHMMDPPRSDAGFAALLPLAGVPAWRVYLGMPLVGRRAVDGTAEAVRADPMMRYIDPVVRQATDEFPAALDELRRRFAADDGPIGLVGASLGGTVALNVLAGSAAPVSAVVLINPAIRARTAVGMVAAATGTPYPWTETSDRAAGRLDFVAQAGLIAARDPEAALLVISGERDEPAGREDARALRDLLSDRYARPDRIGLITIPSLAHSLLEHPRPDVVDRAATEWLAGHLAG
jgi:pimeloyl-ACP methyl ester carboxylesterase